jgi:hypothetical protein
MRITLKHRLSNVDFENRTADCDHCGRVPIRIPRSWSSKEESKEPKTDEELRETRENG